MTRWRCVLELDAQRNHIRGSEAQLMAAIANAADLRIGTEFRHNEHIDVDSPSNELIREVAEFGVTMTVDGRWTAGIMSLRQPIELPTGFGPRPSMSFFLYNQDGTQGIARPFLDGRHTTGIPGPSEPVVPERMPGYQVLDAWDSHTNGPSQNFVYDFDHFRFCVSDSWQEVLRHSHDGTILSGSVEALVEAFSSGCEIKLGLANLCQDLSSDKNTALPHEVFVQGGSAYYYVEQKLFIIGTHPIVRVAANVPVRYSTGAWDFGWLMVRTDGQVVYRSCDPYTLQFSDITMKHPVRWFVR